MTEEEKKEWTRERFTKWVLLNNVHGIIQDLEKKFEPLYEQQRLERFLPTRQQQDVVEHMPLGAWDNPYFEALPPEHFALFVPSQSLYVCMQTSEMEFDYTLYDSQEHILDGGRLTGNGAWTIWDAMNDLFEELEEILIMGDVGVTTAQHIIDELRDRVKKRDLKKPDKLRRVIREVVADMLSGKEGMELDTIPSVILVIGVNGVGKTTTIGKMAAYYKAQGKKVILAAADTFRAAAIEQLEIWADRAGVEIVKHREGADPAAVIFDTIAAGKARDADLIICDTAGRLHNKKNLMEELAKIYRVIDRELPYSDREVLLVLDATTGQNAVNQAREFMNAAEITGIVLTKLDGTARGGVVLSIMDDLKIPVKFVGVGEQVDDLQPFDAEAFAQGLFEEVSREEDGLQES